MHVLFTTHTHIHTQIHIYSISYDQKYSLHFTFTNFDVDKLYSDCTAAQPCSSLVVYAWTVCRSLGRSVSYLLVSLLPLSCSASINTCTCVTWRQHWDTILSPPDHTPSKLDAIKRYVPRSAFSCHTDQFTLQFDSSLYPFHLNRAACLLPVLPCFILSTVLPHSVAQQLDVATRRWPLAKHFVSIYVYVCVFTSLFVELFISLSIFLHIFTICMRARVCVCVCVK